MADEQVTLQVNFEGIKSLKTELKEANNEYQKLINSGQATADQIDAAARKVGNFKDQIKEANERAQALGSAEGKIKAIGDAAQVGVSAFQGIQAAIALTGNESEALEKTMVKLQALMSLQQSIAGLEGAGDAFKNLKTIGVNAFSALKTAIGASGIGLLVIALGTVVAYWDDIYAAMIKTFPVLNDMGKALDKLKQVAMGVGTAIATFVLTPFRIIGKIIQGDIQGALDELKKGLDFKKNFQDGANKEEQRQVDAHNAELAEKRKKAEEEAAKKRKAAAEKAAAERAAENKRQQEEQKRKNEEFEKAQADHIAKMNQMNMSAQDKELAELSAHYSSLIEKYNAVGKDTTGLLEDFEKEQEEIRKRYADKAKEEADKLSMERIKREEDLYKSLKDASDKYINDKIQADRDIYNNDRLSFEERYAALDQELADINTKIFESEAAKTKAIQENADARTQIELAEKQARADIVMGYIGIAAQVGELVTMLAGKNKAAAIAGLAIEKAAAIAGIITNTAMANAKSVAAFPLTGGQPWVTINTVSAGVSIAATLAQTAKAISEINSTNTDSGGGGESKGSKFANGGLLMGRKHAEGGIMTNLGELESGEYVVNRESTANFLPMLEKINSMGSGSGTPNNLSSTVESNQLYNGQQPIIKTYVVASDVTSQQEVQRKINNLARL